MKVLLCSGFCSRVRGAVIICCCCWCYCCCLLGSTIDFVGTTTVPTTWGVSFSDELKSRTLSPLTATRPCEKGEGGGSPPRPATATSAHVVAGTPRAAQTLARTTPGVLEALATLSVLLRRHLSCQRRRAIEPSCRGLVSAQNHAPTKHGVTKTSHISRLVMPRADK